MAELMSKTQLETFADTIGAKAAAVTDGLRTAAKSAANKSLAEQVDATNVTDFEIAMMKDANDLDVALWNRTNFIANQLATLFGPALGALVKAIKADGTYQTIDAYVLGAGAQVSPTFAQLAQIAQGQALSEANVFQPAIAPRAFDIVLAGAEGTLTDYTSEAASAATGDVLFFTNDNEVLYLGLNDLPSESDLHLVFNLTTAADVDTAMTVQYWNGSSWGALANSDAWTNGDGNSATYQDRGTKGMTQNGVIKATKPADWKRTNIAGDGTIIDSGDFTKRYYLRLQRTADTLVTTPAAALIRFGTGMGLVFVTGTNTCHLIPGDSADASYHAPGRLQFRALTAIAASVTATLTYTRREYDANGAATDTAARAQAQSAWSSIDPLDQFPSSSTYLALEGSDTGVKTVTGVAVTTTATAGIFAIESVPLRTEST